MKSMSRVGESLFWKAISECDARHAIHHEQGWDIFPIVVEKTTVKQSNSGARDTGLAYGFFAQHVHEDPIVSMPQIDVFEVVNNTNRHPKTFKDARLALRFLHECYNQKVTRINKIATVNSAQPERIRQVYEKEWLKASMWRKCFCLPVLDQNHLGYVQKYLDDWKRLGRRKCFSSWDQCY